MRFPIEVDVAGREALVIGDSPELPSKLERLLAAGARVTAVCKSPSPALEAFAGRIALERRPLRDEDLAGKFIVFLASGPDELAARLHQEAVASGHLFCSIDRPKTCTFTNVAVVDAADLRMTFSTGGASPGAARRIREDLDALFADPRLAAFLAKLRAARESLPEGGRAAAMSAAVQGFAVEGHLRFPAWFERGEDPLP